MVEGAMKKWLEKHANWFVPAMMGIFITGGNVIWTNGYYAGQQTDYATKSFVKSSLDTLSARVDIKIEKHKFESKADYIEITKIPGLVEQLNAINQNIKDLREELRLQRLSRK